MGGQHGEIRVLHVDDELEFAELTADFLERTAETFDVETLVDPREGLDRLHEDQFDCVVSDFDMPEQNGIEFLEAVRAAYPDLPFILYTGKGSEEVASDAITAGATDYLQKAGGTGQYTILANRIENAVQQRRDSAARLETERRLTELTTHSPDVFWMFTADWEECLFVNDAYEDLYGQPIETLYSGGENALETVHPDDRARVEAAMSRLSNGVEIDVEHRVGADDGYQRWVWVRGIPITDDDGTVTRLAGFSREITTRKEREAELRETSRRLDLAVEATDTGVWEWNIETDELVWNETVERLLGIEPGTFDGTYAAFEEYLHPDDVDTIDRAIERAIEDDGTFTAEFRMVREDGDVIWVRGRGERFSKNGQERLIGTTTDITERKERTNRLDTLISNLPGIVYRCSNDPGWPMEFVRGECVSLTGYAAEEIEAGDVVWGEDVVHPEDQEAVWEAVQHALDADRPFEVTYRIRTKDGTTRWVWERGQLVESRVTDGQMLEGFITDITDRQDRDANADERGLA